MDVEPVVFVISGDSKARRNLSLRLKQLGCESAVVPLAGRLPAELVAPRCGLHPAARGPCGDRSGLADHAGAARSIIGR